MDQELLASLASFAKAKILVVGDAMLDRYWHGDVDRISPEAPVPVVAVRGREARLGGAANVAQNITALGAQCELLTVVGDDEAGEHLQALLRDKNIIGGLVKDKSSGTTTKLRVVARNQQLIRLDFDHQPNELALTELESLFESRFKTVDAVIFSDYGKGSLRRLQPMLEWSSTYGLPSLVDPKGQNFERYRGARVVTPNRAEFTQVVGRWLTEEELEQKAEDLQDSYGIGSILLTRSEQGMSLFQSGKRSLHQVARAREVFDVSGAGDTVIGVYGLALAIGASEEHALHLANVAGGIVVGKLGTAAPTLEEMVRELQREEE